MTRVAYGSACMCAAWLLGACASEEPKAPPATSGSEVDEAAAIEQARKHPTATPPERPALPPSTPPPLPDRGPPPEPPPRTEAAPTTQPPAPTASAAAPAATEAKLVAPQAPPEPYRETRPPPPEPEYVWAPGYWYWYGGRYVWIGGAWLPPRRGYIYVGSRWAYDDGGWVYVPGGWATFGSSVVVYPLYRHDYLYGGHRHYHRPRRSYVHPERGPRAYPDRRDYGRGRYQPPQRGGTSRVRVRR